MIATPAGLIALMAAVIVAYNALAALISKRTLIEYRRFTAGSFVIYAVGGAIGSALISLPVGALVGLTTGFAEATLGWLVAWLIGPGRPRSGRVGSGDVLKTVSTVTLMAGLIGMGGAILAAIFAG